MSNIYEDSLKAHYAWQGKIEVGSRVKIEDKTALSLAYTPGVAQPCLEIEKDPSLSFKLTRRGNLVAVITDGSAVLGLGNIGAAAAMPVMEGKCALFKEFADVDAFPLCIDTDDVDEIVRTVALISKSFGGINLEDISAPRCFEIEDKLKKILDIPVFHDDQHGTAIVVCAGLINALKLAKKDIKEITVVINGAGSAGIAIAKMLMNFKVGNIVLVDKFGAICEGDLFDNPVHEHMSKITNKNKVKGNLATALIGADVFVGVSKPDLVTPEMVKTMADKAIIFAMANPTPEIMPDKAKSAGAFIVGTGRSDFPNQVNNVLAFPGIFKGALRSGAKNITEEMKVSAALSIAGCVSDEELSADFIIPNAFDKSVADAVANAVELTASNSAELTAAQVNMK
ncbi:MAG: NADP-dependent malic enzyme [Ruminococcus sp.]|nr:NADP-dependent malic enzyme [Ruminococcus sp.]